MENEQGLYCASGSVQHWGHTQASTPLSKPNRVTQQFVYDDAKSCHIKHLPDRAKVFAG